MPALYAQSERSASWTFLRYFFPKTKLPATHRRETSPAGRRLLRIPLSIENHQCACQSLTAPSLARARVLVAAQCRLSTAPSLAKARVLVAAQCRLATAPSLAKARVRSRLDAVLQPLPRQSASSGGGSVPSCYRFLGRGSVPSCNRFRSRLNKTRSRPGN